LKESNTFIQQGCIELIKSDSKHIIMLQMLTNSITLLKDHVTQDWSNDVEN